MEGQEEGLDLNELLNLVHVLDEQLQVQQRLPVLLGLVAKGSNVINKDAVNVRRAALDSLEVLQWG